MNYELKYKEALERARKLYEKGTITESLNYVFPELKESEDEKIRKHLISLVKNWDKDGIFSKYTSNPKEIKQILAWLEKLKVFAEHGDGLYYFRNNGFTYVGDSTCDNVSWLEKQGKQVDCPQDLQVPNGGIVLEDFNGGEGHYKVNLDFLNKKQVEEIENIVNGWNKTEERR